MKATVYRHVDVLAGAGVLETAGERRVRGAVERRYRLRRDQAVIDPADLGTEDYRKAFAAAVATLVAEFGAYLDHDPDPVRDQVGFRQHALWLSEAERDHLIAGLRQAITPHLTNDATGERSRYLLSPILFPAAEPEA
ncbi:helix-turn-helix domain-containing protein [Amycolatopsis thermophila]|uniref:DNA-binding transcriptional ArsR family regulator n=1 Tax=Amycolatopsis thermophila TaxID=206084 RepID=A0ABU0EPX1_9PSEU|nr:ArsR family transcriptional regulator [Amycolatopsis thermophila]MDQ0377214.1 DNA-binding transcriptional ArsR family regulator [Amycolatopsis thermophila]